MSKGNRFYTYKTHVIGTFLVPLLLLLFTATPARADCANPAGQAGKTVYNGDLKVLQYCDGTNWIGMHQPGSGSGGCTDPTRPESRMIYNADHRVVQGCAGNVWRALGPVGGTSVDWQELQQTFALNNPTPNTTDWFAGSIALSGTTAVVGAWQDESNGGAGVADAGRAYVYNTSTGALISTLNNPTPNASDNFANSVAVSGNIAVVGAYRDESDGGTGTADAGRAYVFDTTTGSLISTLNNPSPNASDRFGGSVAVSGTIAVIGASLDESDGGTGTADAGRAYVFNATTGALIATLNNPSPNASDNFANSVAVSGNTAVIAAVNDESDGGAGISAAGRAYVFNATTGALIATLNNPSPNATDNFGSGVQVSGNIAVIAAVNDESDGGAGTADAGRAYVFDTTTGALIATLNNPSPNAIDNFASSVAVSGTMAVIGADVDESDGGAGVSAAGRAYVFDTATGNLIATLNNQSPNTSDFFGDAIAVSGSTVVVGARQDESDGGTGTADAGRAYVFQPVTVPKDSALNNPSPNATDGFGGSIAVDGAIAVVGAGQDESDGGAGVSAAGRAYVFDTATGNLIASLSNPSPNASDNFGVSVAVDGTIAVVGAYRDESDGGTGVSAAGRAYVFDTATGNLISTLSNPSPNVSDWFGWSVAVSGTTAVVGAYQDESDGGAGVADAGRAYVFDTATGSLIATLNNPSPNASDWFGWSVAVSGTTAVVGAYQDESDGVAGVADAGRAYVFDTATGSLIATFNNPSPNASDEFGYGVALSGTIAVVGAWLDASDGGTGVGNAGRAYVFDTATGNLISALNNPSPNGSDNFGNNVAVSGTIAVVGAYRDESDGVAGVTAAGRAYVFDTATGDLMATLNNPSPNVSDHFGRGVAVSGTIAVVGADQDESDGGAGTADAGRAYVFEPGIPGVCYSPFRDQGVLLYNSSTNVMQYCDGVEWVRIGK